MAPAFSQAATTFFGRGWGRPLGSCWPAASLRPQLASRARGTNALRVQGQAESRGYIVISCGGLMIAIGLFHTAQADAATRNRQLSAIGAKERPHEPVEAMLHFVAERPSSAAGRAGKTRYLGKP